MAFSAAALADVSGHVSGTSVAVVVGGCARGVWQTGGLIDGGAGSAMPSQPRIQQPYTMLNVVFGAVDSS